MQSYKNTFIYISMWLIINIYLYIIESAKLAKFDWKVVAHWATKDINLVAQQ